MKKIARLDAQICWRTASSSHIFFTPCKLIFYLNATVLFDYLMRFSGKKQLKRRKARTYPNFAKSVHSFMTYRLNPFSISENLGVNKSTSEHMRLNGAPNTKPMSTPWNAPVHRGNGEKSGLCSKTYK